MTARARNFRPRGLVTMVGSLPHRDPAAACRLVLETLPHCPAWPQLPRRSFREKMTVQFSAGMPALVLDEDSEKVYFRIDDTLPGRLEKFYGRLIEDDVDHFALTPDYAGGLDAFLRLLGSADRSGYLKGCVVGPVTFGMTVTDQDRRPAFYHPEVADAIVKSLAMKARWQVRVLKEFCDRVMIFIDEPYLAALGSAVISLREEDVTERIAEVVEAIHGEGALAGIHCCANTDWSVPLKTGVDILNFDAFGYGDNLLLYRERIRDFIAEGGALAWGIVPSSEEIGSRDYDQLRRLLFDFWGRLETEGAGGELVAGSAMITPSCGLGTLSEELSREVLEVLRRFGGEFPR